MYSPEEIATNWTNAKVEDGIVRWKSNNRVPFLDMLEHFLYAGYITPVQVHRSEQVRQQEVEISIANYRKQMENHVPDAEEMYEMRAAFGSGTTVVDVITGKRIQL